MPNFGDTDCRDRLQDAYEALEDLVRDGERDIIANRFNLCEALDTNDSDDVASLYELSVRSLINYFEIYQ